MPSFVPDADLYPFVSRWFDAPSGRVHYIDEGAGRPILLLHGNPTWSFLYRTIVIRLREAFRCVALDYPGFGLSERPAGYGYTPAEHARTVSALIEGLDLRDAVVMGHDWGGPIGLAAAVEHRERIGGLVFGNTWFWPIEGGPAALFGRVMSTPPLQWAILQRNLLVERMIPWGAVRRLPPRVMEHYRAVQPDAPARIGMAELPRQVLAAAPWLAALAASAGPTLRDCPLLLVWGMRDPGFGPDRYLPRWLAAFEDVTLVPLQEARHFIQEDAPHEIADAILDRFR